MWKMLVPVFLQSLLTTSLLLIRKLKLAVLKNFAEIDVPVELASVWATVLMVVLTCQREADAVENNADYKRLYSDDDSWKKKISRLLLKSMVVNQVVFEKS